MHTQKHTMKMNGINYCSRTSTINYITDMLSTESDPNFKNLSFFDHNVTGGRDYGLIAEKFIINDQFTDLTKSNVNEFDALCDGLRIEIKSTRAVSREYKKDLDRLTKNEQGKPYLGKYAIDVDYERPHYLSQYWQQVKPANADWFILHISFKNSHRYFFVPSYVIQSIVGEKCSDENIFKMSPQHNNPKEGTLHLKSVLKYDYMFEIPESITSVMEGIRIVTDRMAKLQK